MDFFFDTPVEAVKIIAGGYSVKCKDADYTCEKCIVSVGRSGSKWMEKICKDLDIPTQSNRVDIGVRVELPAAVFAHLTDELYESKIVYRTEKYGDKVRTFCMNPKGAVVNENTNGIITVNGHSYEDPAKQTENILRPALVLYIEQKHTGSIGYIGTVNTGKHICKIILRKHNLCNLSEDLRLVLLYPQELGSSESGQCHISGISRDLLTTDLVV